jgi:hypothetical protein
MSNPDKMQLTISNHGRTYTAQLPWDAGLVEIIQTTATLLVAVGWSRENIAELMNDSEGGNVWDWETQA